MKSAFIILWALVSLNVSAQEKVRVLDPFQKVVVSPKIKLVLRQGEKESIRVTAANVDASQINILVKGNKLHIYLDDARYIEKQSKMWDDGYRSKRSIYHDASVTAYVTYRELKGVEIRGEEKLICEDTLVARKFKLKAYGRSDIRLTSVELNKFKVVMYGENKLTIGSGTTRHQKYTLYGENKIETKGLESHTASTTIYGEGSISMNVLDEVRLNAFGEPEVWVAGTAHLSKGLVVGRVGIRTGVQ